MPIGIADFLERGSFQQEETELRHRSPELPDESWSFFRLSLEDYRSYVHQ